ncbi:HIRAN domain-containing protein [Rhodococcus sp. NPDC056506]|uniref:HIRAN domain-containing protein n=1 Tax=Rhodococcus sp. NPDC056506 TaxID=3345844 RepID=UPI003673093F
MLYSDLTPASAFAELEMRASRLIVTRRSAADRTYRAIGYLDKVIGDDDTAPTFDFTYLRRVAMDETFVPIVGFRDVWRHYSSSRLFPSFADRVMSAKRPDRPQYLAALSLESDADAWEILTASGGYREGDPIELVSLPSYEREARVTTAHFLAHAVRYCADDASAHISKLKSGDELTLRPDPSNPKDPRAIEIADGDLGLGFVPSPLLDYVHSVIDGGPHRLSVVRANPAETHPHLRLLLRLDGRCDEFVFDRPEWCSA